MFTVPITVYQNLYTVFQDFIVTCRDMTIFVLVFQYHKNVKLFSEIIRKDIYTFRSKRINWFLKIYILLLSKRKVFQKI